MVENDANKSVSFFIYSLKAYISLNFEAFFCHSAITCKIFIFKFKIYKNIFLKACKLKNSVVFIPQNYYTCLFNKKIYKINVPININTDHLYHFVR